MFQLFSGEAVFISKDPKGEMLHNCEQPNRNGLHWHVIHHRRRRTPYANVTVTGFDSTHL